MGKTLIGDHASAQIFKCASPLFVSIRLLTYAGLFAILSTNQGPKY